MQHTKAANAPAWLTTYGPLILSALALLIIAVAWILRDIDQATAIAVIGAILAGNGLVSATQWQAAPGLVSDLQAVISQLMAHIQTLHSQQTSQLATAKMAVVQAAAAPATPIPQVAQSIAQPAVQQQPFPSPSASMLGGLQSAPLNAQTWQRSVQGTGSGG